MGAGSAPSNISGAVITASVPCRRCGYDQRGLAADGLCPECGLESWISLRDAVDPAAGRLPRLADPVGVARALVWLTGCQLITVLLLMARPVAVRIDRLDPSGLRAWSSWTPPGLTSVAGVVALAGLWSVWKMLPPRELRGPTAVRTNSLFVLGAGLALCGVLLVASSTARVTFEGLGVLSFGDGGGNAASLLYHLVVACAAIMSYSGLRGVFKVIGQRSREYRTAKGGRQRVRDIIAAIVGAMLGEVVRLAGILAEADWPARLGLVIVWISMLMLLIGQAYLLFNAWWIGRALRKPRLGLRDVLGPALPPGRVIHPTRDAEPQDDSRGP